LIIIDECLQMRACVIDNM